MDKYQVHFHPEALIDLEETLLWYRSRSVRVARLFLDDFMNAIELVLQNPIGWPKYYQHTHRYIFRRFPYSLVYRIQGENIQVIALAHHKKRPRFWAKR